MGFMLEMSLGGYRTSHRTYSVLVQDSGNLIQKKLSEVDTTTVCFLDK